jgi:anti-sigma factor RsiW
MTGPSGTPMHYGEELQDFLDETLTDARRAEVAAHLETCARCRRELDALRWVKVEASKDVGEAELPADLSARVRAALDTEDKSSVATTISRRKWIAASALVAAALLIVFLRGHKVTLPDRVAAAFRAYDTGVMPLEFESSDPKAIEAYFARNGITFETRVFDLGMMQYHLVGGRVHRLDDDRRISALFAYRGPGARKLVCQMFQGTVAELPRTDDVREHNGIRFHVYGEGNVTLVFWQEGDTLCVLTSDAPADDVVQLAFAKAVRA